MTTINEKFKEKIKKYKNTELCRCPFCNSPYIEDNITHTWRDWFVYGVEGGFWEVIGFALKWIIFFYAFFYIGANTIYYWAIDPEVAEFLCQIK